MNKTDKMRKQIRYAHPSRLGQNYYEKVQKATA